MQVLLEVEHYQKAADELSTLLKNSEVEREKCIEEHTESRSYIHALESKMKEMLNQLAENAKVREQLLNVLNELKVAQEDLLNMETELAAARDLQLKAMMQAEMMEVAANMDREKLQELLKHVSELNEAILRLKLAAIEADKEKFTILSEKDDEIELAMASAAQAQEQLEDMRRELESMQELEIQVLEKSTLVDMLILELKQADEQLRSYKEAASDAMSGLENLKAELEIKEGRNSDQALYIETLETDMDQLKVKLINANEEIDQVKTNVGKLTSELEKTAVEMDAVKEREIEAQEEIALLKSEVHKGRSKIAAAEAAEARAESAKSGLYLAVQQLAVEAEEAKKENQRLKQRTDEEAEETETSIQISSQVENSLQNIGVSLTDEPKTNAEENKYKNAAFITTTLEEYESLMRKAEKADQIPAPPTNNSYQLAIITENTNEVDALKKELEVAMLKIEEFRTRAEQAFTRAETAERAKTAVEGQLRKWREQKEKRKAALAALREESVGREYDPPGHMTAPKKYQPLGEVLNMKF